MGKATRVLSQPGRSVSPRALARVVASLRRLYGRPRPPSITDPFQLILHENVAYLADDTRRDEAFEMLQTRVGLSPAKILAAPRTTLLVIARRGIVPAQTVDKLRKTAAVALEEFGGNLAEVTRRALQDAKKALKKFPSIGDPGAEKILLFSKSQPILALDSNGLRVLLRLGFGREEKSYAKSYRSAQEAAAPELPLAFDVLIEAHQLLRRHGQELCKRSHPRCELCPLRGACAYARAHSPGVQPGKPS